MCVFGMNKVFSRALRVGLPRRSCQGPRQGVKWSVGCSGSVSYCGQCRHYTGQPRSIYNVDINTHAQISVHTCTWHACAHINPYKLNCIVQGHFGVWHPCIALIINDLHYWGHGLATFYIFLTDSGYTNLKQLIFRQHIAVCLVHVADNFIQK